MFLARCPWHSVFECRPIPPIRPTTSIYDNNRLTHLAFPPSFPPTEATNDALARSLAIRCSLMHARSEDASPPRRQKGFSLPFRGFLMSFSLSFRFGRATGLPGRSSQAVLRTVLRCLDGAWVGHHFIASPLLRY